MQDHAIDRPGVCRVIGAGDATGSAVARRFAREPLALVVIGGRPTASSDVERCGQGADAVIDFPGIGH